MAGNDVVAERLAALRDEIVFLKSERESAASLVEYSSDARLRRAVERSLQMAIEICLDIGRRIISLENLQYPEDDREVFSVLAESQVVDPDLLPELQRMASFRNLLVHDYVRLDDERVYDILTRDLATFDRFAAAILDYVAY